MAKKKTDASKKTTKKKEDLEEVVLTDEEADKVTGGTDRTSGEFMVVNADRYTISSTGSGDDPPTTESQSLNN